MAKDKQNKTVADLIMESLEGALKRFVSDPPREAYSVGDGYFSWYVHIADSDGNGLTKNTEDYFYDELFECSCVTCDVGLLEDVVMYDDAEFSQVEDDVREWFRHFLDNSNEDILNESADKVDLSKSFFKVRVYEVTNSGQDIWEYYNHDHIFEHCVSNDK